MQGLSNGKTKSAQSGVTGGNGKNDNAEDSDDTANITKDILTDDANSCGSAYLSGAHHVVHTHCACSPNHSNEAFEDHHVVEGVAAFALALHGTGDDAGLGGMETGENAAGNGNKEYGQEVISAKVLAVVDNALIGPRSIPKLNERITLEEDTCKYADSGEKQDAAKYRVDLSDDGIDGEYSSEQVVSKDNAVNDPSGGIVCRAGESEYLSCSDIAGGIDEHRAYKQKQKAYKNVVDPVNGFVGVLFDDVGHLDTAVTKADHTGEVVMECTADDIADRDGDKCDRTKQNALYRSKDGSGTCDVEQVDEAVFPAGHGYVVNAVLLGVSRGLSVIRSKNLFTELAVKCSAYHEDNETDQKCRQKNSSFCLYGQMSNS